MEFNSELFEKFESSKLAECYFISGGARKVTKRSNGDCDEIKNDGPSTVSDCCKDTAPGTSWDSQPEQTA